MYADLNNVGQDIITGNDSIVIVENFETVRGGRTLDVTGFTPTVINAGHVLIKETSTKNYKPMPVVGSGAIATLGAIVPGSTYTNGTYTGVSLTGGSGTGAIATITVAGAVVTSVVVTTPGSGYKAGDTLSAAAAGIGGTGSGFSVGVATVGTAATAYGTLPSGHTYAGILVASVLTAKPFAAILVRGTVNPAATPFSMTTIQSAFSTAQPLILFRED